MKLTLCKARRHDPGLSNLSYELYTQSIFGTIVKKLLLGPIANPSMESKTNIFFFKSLKLTVCSSEKTWTRLIEIVLRA